MRVNIKIYYFSVFGRGSFIFNLDSYATVLDALNVVSGKFGEVFMRETGRGLMEAFTSYINVFLNGKHLGLPSQFMYSLKDWGQLFIIKHVGGVGCQGWHDRSLFASMFLMTASLLKVNFPDPGGPTDMTRLSGGTYCNRVRDKIRPKLIFFVY